MRIAGVDIALETDPGLLRSLREGWQGYETHADVPPDIRVRYRPVAEFAAPQPADREYPGFGVRALLVDDGGVGDIELTRRDVRGRIDAARGEARFEGADARHALEAALRVTLAMTLPRLGGLLLHSSGVVMGAHALLFSGPSGAGKSTLLRLLAEAETEAPLRRLGDDLTAIRRGADGRFHAHATPFAGELGPAADATAPLRAIYFLRQAPGHATTALAPAEAVRHLLRNALTYAVTPGAAAALLSLAAEIAAAVECRVLAFAKDTGVAAVLAVT
jgi:hypothetical protein